MATTTPAKVKGLTGSTLDDAAIQPFVDAATLIISDAEEQVTVSEDRANLAADYLASHLLVTSNVGKASAQTKREDVQNMIDTEFNVGKPEGMGVKSTHFGTMANQLMNGVLSENEKVQPQLLAVGSIGC